VGLPPCGVHVIETGTKTARCSKMNGFVSSMIKDIWFCGLVVETKLRQELDAQKWTLS
jgi:hypothetical protein